MATKKAAPGSTSKEEAVHRISALLHTMRCIAQHEDQLCTLLHAARNNRSLTARFEAELRSLLDSLPSHEYTDDMDAVRQTLTVAPAAPRRKHLTGKKAAVAPRARAKAGSKATKPAARRAMGRKQIGRRGTPSKSPAGM